MHLMPRCRSLSALQLLAASRLSAALLYWPLICMAPIAATALCCAHWSARRDMIALWGVPGPPHAFLAESKFSLTKAEKPVACRGYT